MGPLPGVHLRRKQASYMGSYFPVRTLCAGQDQPWVRHVVAQVHVGPAAQDPTSFLQWDIRFYGNGIGTNDRPAGSSLTLDFSTLRISGRARTNSPPRGKCGTNPKRRAMLPTRAPSGHRFRTSSRIWRRNSWSLCRSCHKGHLQS